jgi:hypothetical protein
MQGHDLAWRRIYAPDTHTLIFQSQFRTDRGVVGHIDHSRIRPMTICWNGTAVVRAFAWRLIGIPSCSPAQRKVLLPGLHSADAAT